MSKLARLGKCYVVTVSLEVSCGGGPPGTKWSRVHHWQSIVILYDKAAQFLISESFVQFVLIRTCVKRGQWKASIYLREGGRSRLMPFWGNPWVQKEARYLFLRQLLTSFLIWYLFLNVLRIFQPWNGWPFTTMVFCVNPFCNLGI